jgi:TPR repeat protein
MIATLRIPILFALAVMVSACATNLVAEKASRFDQGIAAYDSGDFAAAYRIWAELAREDDLGAMRNAAQLLRQGKGVEKDSVAAFNLYREAAEKGLVTAMANVGEMYLSGEGTQKNPEAAAAWYARAATAGLSIAQMKMSELYDNGIGVERDPSRARALLERAARNGYAPAQAKLRAMGATFAAEPVSPTPGDVDLDDPWRGGGTVTGAFGGTTHVGETGARMSPGDPIDRAAAAKMPAADLVQLNAGLSAYAAKNESLAFASWRNVAQRGNAEGQLRLGLLYARGEGIGQDMIEAYRWLKLASDQGHPKAKAELSSVAAQLAPAERAIAESLVKLPAGDATKPR